MTIVSTRAEAKAAGASRYSTGKACKHGHVCERMTHNGECCDCKSSAKKEWVGRNADRVKVQKANSYSRHKEKILAKMRAQYAVAPDGKKENAKRRRVADPVGHAQYNQQWREKNRDKDRAWAKQWRAANPEYARNNSRKYRIANPHAGVVKEQMRRARKLMATPKWFGEFDLFVLKEAAQLAKAREAIFGFKWHIDHLVPLRAKEASGLHCASNFAVIPCRVNLQKSRSMCLTQPGQWISAI